MLKTYLVTGLLFVSGATFAQEPETTDTTVVDEAPAEEAPEEDYPYLSGSFKATRIINGHSTETLNKGELEFRVEHRFGDFAGSNGGVQQWFGLDNSSDIRIAFEYGLTDKLMLGIGRSKGTGRPYRSLLDGLVKMKILEEAKRAPVSVTAMGMMTYTYMKASSNIYDVAYFPKWEHRLAYAAQINVSRQVTRRFSAALMPTFVYRNYVAADDVNALFALGGAVKCGITKQMGIILEYYHSFYDKSIRTENMQSFGVAVEWITFGHTFTINLTNSKGFGETQFIPYTYENWLKGQFRLGFTIGRIFTRG